MSLCEGVKDNVIVMVIVLRFRNINRLSRHQANETEKHT